MLTEKELDQLTRILGEAEGQLRAVGRALAEHGRAMKDPDHRATMHEFEGRTATLADGVAHVVELMSEDPEFGMILADEVEADTVQEQPTGEVR